MEGINPAHSINRLCVGCEVANIVNERMEGQTGLAGQPTAAYGPYLDTSFKGT
jgi:hypothetical protein